MEKGCTKSRYFKLIAIAMAVMVGLSFMPLLEDGACALTDKTAGSSESGVSAVAGKLADTGSASKAGSYKNSGISKGALSKLDIDNGSVTRAESNLKEALGAAAGTKATGTYRSVCNVKKFKMSGNKLLVDMSIRDQYREGETQYAFIGFVLDGEGHMFENFAYAVKENTSLARLGTGYHSLVYGLAVSHDSGANWEFVEDDNYLIGRNLRVNTITAKPGFKGKYEVYSKYFNLYPYDAGLHNQKDDLYLEYKARGAKKWKRSGAMQCGMVKLPTQYGFKFRKLKPNKKYYTRLRYGQKVRYEKARGGDGKLYFFGGPRLKSRTIKTGKAKKPSIRSIKVKCINVKYHAVKHPGHYEWVGNVLIWRDTWTERYYTCSVWVTVRLKKKTGARGIVVNGKFLKGNKKKYSYKYTPYPNYYLKKPPKGTKKLTVKVRSYQRKSYGGFSPIAKRKVRAR